MESINQLFSNLGTDQSILILSWLIIAFLFGLLAGYFLRNRFVKTLNQQLEEKEQLLTTKQIELDQAQQELALKEADLKRAAFEAEEAQSKIRRSTEEIGRLNQLVASAQVELDKAKVAEQASANLINDLNDQILGLKTRNAQLIEGGAVEGTSGSFVGGIDAAERLAAIEIQLARLTEENSQLLRKLGGNADMPETPVKITSTGLPQNEPDPGVTEGAGEFFVPKPDLVEPIQETPNLGTDSSSTLMNSDKVLLRNVDKNDLTAINGIGPFLEKKLNDAGVFTYADIAAWDSAKIAEITEKISFFEGRIEKDDWVGQAKNLLNGGSAENTDTQVLDGARDLGAVETHVVHSPDDLKRVMGIDESIEKILFTAGINSFAELAKMEPDEIRNLLVVVDPALEKVDPSTWPAQARLAFDEEWEVLQDYQEQIKGA